jgi:hypothetical protein
MLSDFAFKSLTSGIGPGMGRHNGQLSDRENARRHSKIKSCPDNSRHCQQLGPEIIMLARLAALLRRPQQTPF